MKDLERDAKLINGSGQELEKNLSVYSEYEELLNELKRVDSLYNMARNYLTKKPFSTEKFKINFEKPTFLKGWDYGNEESYLGFIMEKDEKYYLAVMDKMYNKTFRNIPTSKDDDVYRKVIYKQISSPEKSIQNLLVIDGKTVKKNGRKQIGGPHDGENIILEDLKNTYLPQNINAIRKKKSYLRSSESWSKSDMVAFIAYYQKRVLEYYDGYNFIFKNAEDYSSFQEFQEEVAHQAYQISYVNVPSTYIQELVDTGKLYLFQIYNKDFSSFSKGNLNLHTLYFKMLFDQRNLDNVVYKLNGEAEVFYRPASIAAEELIIHKAGAEIGNKNPNRAKVKATSTFDYDIVKDRRYSQDKFTLHIPITMNFGVNETGRFNYVVNAALKKDNNVNVIGIDRGERNLLYVVVIDSSGNILEQISLNSIVNKEYDIETNYHKLLDEKEGDRDKARKDWNTIENIKELKEGYLSQVVNVIAKLVLKYNAIICLEDLNFGFKRGRQKVEKQVYQKFEKMLIDKLNYLVIDKTREQKAPEAIGGALNALQLTSKFTSFREMGKQTGIIYYVPAYLTSKIDPTTGFANLFYVKYESVKKARDFIAKFDFIRFNKAEDYFEFGFDYKSFTQRACGPNSKWVVCTYGERIIKYRNPDKNNAFDDLILVMTDEFKALFDKYDIAYEESNDIKESILSIEEKDFYHSLIRLFNQTLQMRNSSADGSRDYIISPVKNHLGEFFNSESPDDSMPNDADANGAYNIARKGLWVLAQINDTTEDKKLNLAMSNAEWLDYAQTHLL